RPCHRRKTARERAFPPHTRGSTRDEADEEDEAEVSPAYAGIDRLRSAIVASGSGFPRIRGDRPRSRTACSSCPPFPPHTRGSTSKRGGGRESVRVSPAYAGIDPRSPPEPEATMGFPRIRGDRPTTLGRDVAELV